MGFWTKFGAIVGGVLCGPAGTIAGAVNGGVVDHIRENGRQEGREEAKAEDALKIKKMEELINKISEKLKQHQEHYQFIIALTAVGIATANADGIVSQCELDDLKEFIVGISNKALPDTVKSKIAQYENKPPTFEEALAEVKKLTDIDPNDFRMVIQLIAESDGEYKLGEQIFLKKWDEAFPKKQK